MVAAAPFFALQLLTNVGVTGRWSDFPRNREIYAYYAERQPDREFFRYDFANASLTRLGSATELAARPAPPSQ